MVKKFVAYVVFMIVRRMIQEKMRKEVGIVVLMLQSF